MQHKNRKYSKKDKGSIDAEELCVEEFIKLMAINSWLLFYDNLHFVLIVENLFGKLLIYFMYTNVYTYLHFK